MNWNRILVAASIVGVACATPQAQEADVEKAFTAARAGDSSAVSRLADLGPRIVPEVQEYLDDTDENIRREAVSLLAAVKDEAACRALVPALADASPEIRERAARALYANCDPAVVAQTEGAESALIRSVELGNSAAGATLLLGYVETPAANTALDAVAQNKKGVKLQPWTQPVPASLPAAVALSRHNDPLGGEQLLQSIANNVLAEQVFLFHVIRDIDDAKVLSALANHLSDEREISGGVPSGAAPRPRLGDLAVNAFAEKLNLDLGFELSTSRRYSSDELEKAKQAVSQALAAP
jgi:HEAT repeat protein